MLLLTPLLLRKTNLMVKFYVIPRHSPTRVLKTCTARLCGRIVSSWGTHGFSQLFAQGSTSCSRGAPVLFTLYGGTSFWSGGGFITICIADRVLASAIIPRLDHHSVPKGNPLVCCITHLLRTGTFLFRRAAP